MSKQKIALQMCAPNSHYNPERCSSKMLVYGGHLDENNQYSNRGNLSPTFNKAMWSALNSTRSTLSIWQIVIVLAAWLRKHIRFP